MTFPRNTLATLTRNIVVGGITIPAGTTGLANPHTPGTVRFNIAPAHPSAVALRKQGIRSSQVIPRDAVKV